MTDRLTTADASKVSASEFLRTLRGDPNDISRCEQAGGYYLRDGAWFKIKAHHYGVRDDEQLTQCLPDPLIALREGDAEPTSDPLLKRDAA
jgi:hypothetical protein